jgi:hypothetical protein
MTTLHPLITGLLRNKKAGWAVVGACLLLALTIGGSAGYLSVAEQAPQPFDSFVGPQHYQIPWQYAPRGFDGPTASGISVRLCLASLLGTRDAACSHSKQEQVSIYPAKFGFAASIEEASWQHHPDHMQPAGTSYGHQAYIHAIAAEGGRPGLTLHYFRLTDADGKLLRSVTCYESGSCNHYAIVGNHLLFYTAPESDFSDWGAIDHKLTELADSWTVR